MDSPADLMSNNDDRKDRLNGVIAVSIAILATFMAVTKVKDDNIVQTMLQAKSDAVDTWAEYQGKRIRQSVLESSREQLTALRALAPAAAGPTLDEQIRHDEAEIARYKKEEADLNQQARAKEAQYDTLNYRDDQFDLSDAALAVAIALLAIVALTHRRWLLGISWVFAALGLTMGMAGLMGLPLHRIGSPAYCLEWHLPD